MIHQDPEWSPSTTWWWRTAVRVHGSRASGEKTPGEGRGRHARGHTSRHVVMKPLPGAPFEVIEPEFAFQCPSRSASVLCPPQPRRHGGALGFALHAAKRCVMILNHMAQYSGSRLDASFAALSDATRRGVLEQLGRADASITDLAEKFHMTLTGIKKHVGVLEQAGLVMTEKVGRVRTCKLGLRRLDDEAAWIERHRQLWDARFDELDKVVEELTRKEKKYGRKKSE